MTNAEALDWVKAILPSVVALSIGVGAICLKAAQDVKAEARKRQVELHEGKRSILAQIIAQMIDVQNTLQNMLAHLHLINEAGKPDGDPTLKGLYGKGVPIEEVKEWPDKMLKLHQDGLAVVALAEDYGRIPEQVKPVYESLSDFVGAWSHFVLTDLQSVVSIQKEATKPGLPILTEGVVHDCRLLMDLESYLAERVYDRRLKRPPQTYKFLNNPELARQTAEAIFSPVAES